MAWNLNVPTVCAHETCGQSTHTAHQSRKNIVFSIALVSEYSEPRAWQRGANMQAMEPDASSDAILSGELNDLLVVFNKISGGNQHVDLKTILRLPELKAQITEGDVAIEDLEGAWLEACAVERWSSLAGWDRNKLVCLWDGDGPAGSVKDLDGFKEFCRAWERKCWAISAYHPRLHESSFQANAHLEKTQPGAKSLESKPIAAKPIARQSLDTVQRASIARPASEELEDKKRGVKGHEDEGDELETKNSRHGEALDATMTHDHARWGSHPSQPGEIPRKEALDQLRGTGLSKRLSLQELTGRGINVIDADASYASLVHKVLQAHRGFKKSSAQLTAVLCEHSPSRPDQV